MKLTGGRNEKKGQLKAIFDKHLESHKIKKGENKMTMSEELEAKFKERMLELTDLNHFDFEDEKLLGLHVIVNKLSSIEVSLHIINDHLGKIKLQK